MISCTQASKADTAAHSCDKKEIGLCILMASANLERQKRQSIRIVTWQRLCFYLNFMSEGI